MSAIETAGLTKEFGSLTAVDSLDITIESGEIYGFLGPNGAGKSTTINMLLDLTRPSDGSASILGYDCQSESPAIRERIGVLPEGFDLYGRLTGRHHLEFAIRAKGVDDTVERLVDRIGLDLDDADRTVDGYSKGMRQRLALGMALAGDPEVLILDEPSSGLDPTGIQEVQDIVTAEASDGTAVFFSSHILGEVEAVCDRVGILNDGVLVADGSIDKLREETVGADTLILTLDEPPAEAVGSVSTVDGVSSVEQTDGQLLVDCTDPRAKARAIDAVEGLGATVVDIRVRERSLSDVFSALTTTREAHRDA